MTLYEEIRQAVNRAATALKEQGKQTFKRAEVETWIRQNGIEDWDRFAPSFQRYFSKMQANDDQCIVEGVPGSFQYRIAVATVGAPQPKPPGDHEPPVEPPADNQRQQREAKLYQILRNWLEGRSYQAAVTASLRRGRAWGNPDVTGLRVDELPLGSITFECATIEAKMGSEDWRYWLFEAVSHKRFAHRAYFAFAIGTDSPSVERLKDLDTMCQYAEKYRIGILVVFISTPQYEQLTNGNVTGLTLDEDNTRIETVWPAFYEPVQVPALNEFLTQTLELRSHNDLRRFGTNA
jgi:hypothetical protein